MVGMDQHGGHGVELSDTAQRPILSGSRMPDTQHYEDLSTEEPVRILHERMDSGRSASSDSRPPGYEAAMRQ